MSKLIFNNSLFNDSPNFFHLYSRPNGQNGQSWLVIKEIKINTIFNNSFKALFLSTSCADKIERKKINARREQEIKMTPKGAKIFPFKWIIESLIQHQNYSSIRLNEMESKLKRCIWRAFLLIVQHYNTFSGFATESGKISFLIFNQQMCKLWFIPFFILNSQKTIFLLFLFGKAEDDDD